MGGGRAAPRWPWQWAQKDGRARAAKTHNIIYLSRVLCLCVSQLRNAQALLFVLVIKLTRRVRRGRDRDGETGKRQIVEGGSEETFHCWSQTWETCRFTVPPAFALLNYISSGIQYFGGFFPQLEFSRGFLINFAVYLCTFARCVFNLHVCNTTNNLNIRRKE